jgi:hypothetical protein
MNAAAPALPHGWVPIGERRWRSAWIGGTWLFAVVFIANGLNLSIILGRIFDVSPFAMAGALLLILVAILALVTFVHNRRWPQPAVNLDTSELRAGTKVVPLAHIDSASLGVTPLKRTRVVILRITAGKEARAEFVLRDRKDRTPGTTTTRVLAEALRRTTIIMPVSKDDPTGRFAHYNFPGHITREEAVALALSPPTMNEPLPTPS